MKYNKLLLKTILLIFFFINIFTNNLQAGKQAFIVMKINNVIVTNLNIEKELRYLFALNNDLISVKKEDALVIAKNSYLREKIKEIEILKYFVLGNYENNEYLEQTLQKLYKNLNLRNEYEFKTYLSKYDLTINDVKKKLEIELKWNELVFAKFKNNVSIDIEKIKEKIKKNETKKNYLLSEIFFTLEKKNQINERYDLIKKSISEIGFKGTVTKYSISDTARLGGNIGWISENELSKDIIKELKKIKINEITKPINLAGGFLILKLEKIEYKETSIDFDEELKKQVSNENNRQLNQFSLIYYNKIKFNSIIDEE